MEIGKMIRQIRLDKNLSQKYLSTGIMNASHYSKFERGETTTNAENFLKILHRLNVTYEEFILQDRSEIFMLRKRLMHDFAKAFTSGNTKKLAWISEETAAALEIEKDVTLDHLHNLSNVYMELFENDFQLESVQNQLNMIKSYLLKVNTWGIYEYVILNNALGTFSLKEVIYFAKKTRKQLEKFTITDKTYIANAILYNASLLLLESDHFEQSFEFAKASIQVAQKHANTFELITSKITYHTAAYFVSKQDFVESELVKCFVALEILENKSFYTLIKRICQEKIPELDEKLQNIHI